MNTRTIRWRTLGRLVLLAGLACGFGVIGAPDLHAATRATQRATFEQALDALERDDRATFFGLEAKLRNYVLHPHLRYALARYYLKHSPWAVARREVLHFAKANPESELAFALIRDARRRLRDDGDWEGALDGAAWPGARSMPCLELRARVALGRQTGLRDADRTRWTSLNWPSDCKHAFHTLMDADRISGPDLWSRIAALMDRGRIEQAERFYPLLSNTDDALLELWIAGHTDPVSHVDDPRIQANTAFNRTMARHFVSRWARRDPAAAARHIATLAEQGRYDASTRAAMLRTVALRAAVDYHPDALAIARAIPVSEHTRKTRAWQVRSALRLADWRAALQAIEAMPPMERADPAWRYWRAHALIKLGDGEAGNEIMAELADTRSYYGFLASDRVEQPYQLRVDPMPRNASIRRALQARADVQRAREYWVLGMDNWAQRAWRRLARELSDAEFLELVIMAHDWGWHDRSLAGNARTSFDADLPLRFPFAFAESVLKYARSQRLDPSWVFATMRRESGFRPAVASGAGAIGLMQLMPRTAQHVAKSRGEVRTGDLTEPARNIQLGTHYLAQLRERFKGATALSTAGYNAGPSRIKRWLSDSWVPSDATDTARWVETLPIDETRDYVQAVMAYATVYDWLANDRQDVPISRRMGPLPRLD